MCISGREGEGESGRAGEWESGRVGERESGFRLESGVRLERGICLFFFPFECMILRRNASESERLYDGNSTN